VLFAALFGLGWLISAAESLLLHRTNVVTMGITSALGLGLVYSMAQVYRLRSAPNWNTWKTNTGFIASAMLMGIAAMTALLAYLAEIAGIQIPSTLWSITGGFALILLAAQSLWMPRPLRDKAISHLRTGLIFTGILFTVLNIWQASFLLHVLILATVIIEETLGRWLFYRARS
jgi:DMSO reductase anchor subunit